MTEQGAWRAHALVLLLACGTSAAARDGCRFGLIGGEVTRHDYPGFHGHIRIYTPSDPAPESGYPAIFYYHGWSDGLEPNVRIMRAVTGGRDYLLVGMNYRSRKFYDDLERRAVSREVERFEDVLDELARCRPVNRQAVFLAGYSQGGYAVSLIGEERIDGIAGLVMLGAGRRQGSSRLPRAEDVAGWHLFFGVGADDDPHRERAEISARIYALLGAEVSMEIWPATDHIRGWRWYQDDPSRGAGLKSWLDQAVADRLAAGASPVPR